MKSGDRVVIEARLMDDVGGLLTGGTTTAKLFDNLLLGRFRRWIIHS